MKFVILNSNPVGLCRSQKKIYENAFKMWKEQFSSVYSKSDKSSCKALSFDEFYRQQAMSAILDEKNQIISTHLYGKFSIDNIAHQAHSYMKSYPKQYIPSLLEKGIKEVMTAESLLVNPDYRKSNFGTLQMILSFKFAKYFHNIDAVIGPCLKSAGVHNLAYKLGADCIVEDVPYKGLLCDHVALIPDHLKIPEKLKMEVMRLWKSRTDYTQLTEEEANVRRRPSLAA